MECLKGFNVYTEMNEEEVPAASNIIPLRWVLGLRNKKGGSAGSLEVRSRIVAMEVNRGEPLDSFAGTPSTVGILAVIFLATYYRLELILADALTAFLQADIGSEDGVYV